jgi:hypothetical protein
VTGASRRANPPGEAPRTAAPRPDGGEVA